MLKKIIKPGILLSFVLVTATKAQDIHFSQITETPLLINPANAGLFDGYQRAHINYKSQWASAGSPFKTLHVSYDREIGMKRLRNAYLGVGAFIFQDKAGTVNWGTFNADIFVNGIVKLGEKSKIALGLGGGYAQSSADFSKLTYGNQYDGKEFNTSYQSLENMTFRSYNFLDLAAGLCFDYGKTNTSFDHNNLFGFRIGIAAYHIDQPLLKYRDKSKEKLPQRITGSLTVKIDIPDSKLSVLPNALFQMQAGASEITAGTLLRIRFNDQTKITGLKHETSMYVGANYRISDAIIPVLMFEMYGFNVGFSYDFNNSNFQPATKGAGGFEISLRWIYLRDGLYKQKSEFGTSKTGSATVPK